jgi:hypothetical protein
MANKYYLATKRTLFDEKKIIQYKDEVFWLPFKGTFWYFVYEYTVIYLVYICKDISGKSPYRIILCEISSS